MRPLPIGKRTVFAVRHAPTTAAATHEALARAYEEHARTYRQVAQVQRDLLAILKAEPPQPSETQQHNVARLEMKSKALINDADKLATDAQRAADLQYQRARELSSR